MSSPVHASANPHLSGRPQSGTLDDYNLENKSTRSGRVTKPSSPRTSVARTDRRHRKHQSQTPRGRRTPSSQFVHHADSPALSFSAEPNYSISPSPRIELKRIHSSPMVLPTCNKKTEEDVNMRLDDVALPLPAQQDIVMEHDSPIPEQLNEDEPASEEQCGMVKQLKTNPITHEQLVPEVRGIYRGLVMVEEKCIALDKQQSESKEDLSPVQWQALISIHSTLLHEHHDFFLSSQHPVAKAELTELAEKYSMPARMWRYGIHSLLEILRHKLPRSLEYMLHFIYTAYSMVTLLLENIPYFRETWIECLGDLARYRMAIEETDMRDREVWATVSRYWYNQDADLSHDIGRVQHHLAVLARPDALAQLFYYTKALLCRRPFLNASDSITLLFSSFREQQRQDSMPVALIATHAVLFHKMSDQRFITLANHYLSLLQRDISLLDAQGQGGAFVMSSNIAAMFQYGEPDNALALEFPLRKPQATARETYELALQWTSPAPQDINSSKSIPDPEEITSKISAPTFKGSALVFHSLSVFLDHLKDPNAYAGIHTGLSFVWSLAIHQLAMERLEPMIPWLKIIRCLNRLAHFPTDFKKIEGDSHPRFTIENEKIKANNNIRREQGRRERERLAGKSGEKPDEELDPEIPDHLPEDFLIRGQIWSESYYPDGFFEGAPSEHDRPFVKPRLLELVRRHRCLWLGVRLSTFNRWITYDRSRPNIFEPTSLTVKYAAFAASCGGLNSNFSQGETSRFPPYTAVKESDMDFDMEGG
ncbi:hypothetical protein VI817_008655 [Penicillium citrinum]|nr:hypothetical protein VI817_008655 [Penicillium citrinum]